MERLVIDPPGMESAAGALRRAAAEYGELGRALAGMQALLPGDLADEAGAAWRELRAIGEDLEALAAHVQRVAADFVRASDGPPACAPGPSWLLAWADLARHDPQGAAAAWAGEAADGVGQGLGDLLAAVELVSSLTDPVGWARDPGGRARELLGLGLGLAGLARTAPAYALADPAGSAREYALLAQDGLDLPDLERGDLPRWQGRLAPTAVLVALTDGAGAEARAPGVAAQTAEAPGAAGLPPATGPRTTGSLASGPEALLDRLQSLRSGALDGADAGRAGGCSAPARRRAE